MGFLWFTLQPEMEGIFSQFIQITGGLALFIGSVAFAFKTWKETTQNVDQEAISSLNATVNALKEENRVLTNENTSLKAKIVEQEKLIVKAQADVDMLKTFITGRDILEQVAKKIDGFQTIIPAVDEFRSNHQAILKQLDEISDSLAGRSTRKPFDTARKKK